MKKHIYELRKHHTEFYYNELKRYNHDYNRCRFNNPVTLYNMTADSAFDLVLDDRLNRGTLDYDVIECYPNDGDALKALDNYTAEVFYMNGRIYIDHYSVTDVEINEDGDGCEYEIYNCQNIHNPYTNDEEEA